jgi:hypothetical protein
MESRLFLIGLILALAVGCLSFKAVDRGDWRRVHTKDALADAAGGVVALALPARTLRSGRPAVAGWWPARARRCLAAHGDEPSVGYAHA